MKTILEVKDLIKKNGAMEVMGDLLTDHETLYSLLLEIDELNVKPKAKTEKQIAAMNMKKKEEQTQLVL